MRPRTRLALATAALGLASAALGSGCYHYSFEQEAAAPKKPKPPPSETVTYSEHVPTYLNGFVGTGTVDTHRYCDEPVRTELRVTGEDVLVAMATLLVYTPHTLYVTCELPGRDGAAH
jgi:hypothetical protein